MQDTSQEYVPNSLDATFVFGCVKDKLSHLRSTCCHILYPISYFYLPSAGDHQFSVNLKVFRAQFQLDHFCAKVKMIYICANCQTI
jgi:hypothetical protein